MTISKVTANRLYALMREKGITSSDVCRELNIGYPCFKAMLEGKQPCFHRACSCCVNYMSQEEEQELRVISLHIMQAWTGAKNEILKTCGCRTAFDIMEKWEAKTDGREGTD